MNSGHDNFELALQNRDQLLAMGVPHMEAERSAANHPNQRALRSLLRALPKALEQMGVAGADPAQAALLFATTDDWDILGPSSADTLVWVEFKAADPEDLSRRVWFLHPTTAPPENLSPEEMDKWPGGWILANWWQSSDAMDFEGYTYSEDGEVVATDHL